MSHRLLALAVAVGVAKCMHVCSLQRLRCTCGLVVRTGRLQCLSKACAFDCILLINLLCCRWKEAHDAGKAPPIVLSGCHVRALDYVDLDVLKKYAVPEDEQTDKGEL